MFVQLPGPPSPLGSNSWPPGKDFCQMPGGGSWSFQLINTLECIQLSQKGWLVKSMMGALISLIIAELVLAFKNVPKLLRIMFCWVHLGYIYAVLSRWIIVWLKICVFRGSAHRNGLTGQKCRSLVVQKFGRQNQGRSFSLYGLKFDWCSVNKLTVWKFIQQRHSCIVTQLEEEREACRQ